MTAPLRTFAVIPPSCKVALTWEADVAREGIRSVRIASPTPNDAVWTETVTLEPDHNYLLSSWIRTQDVAHTTELADAGANLCLWGTWQHTPALTGTHDWTYVRMVFNSGPTGTVTICARLGYWAGVTTGTSWFDDLRVTEILASDPHPRWKILALIYDRTDLTYADSAGDHHVIGHIESAQVAAAAENATRFVETDIPALSSGNMTCHNRQTHALWEGSVHDSRNLSCVTCHSIHSFKSEQAQLKAPTQMGLCVTCHRDKVAKLDRSGHMTTAQTPNTSVVTKARTTTLKTC